MYERKALARVEQYDTRELRSIEAIDGWADRRIVGSTFGLLGWFTIRERKVVALLGLHLRCRCSTYGSLHRTLGYISGAA